MSVFVCFLEKQSIVAYVSDLSPSSSSTEYVISKSAGAQLDLLILDTIYKRGSHDTRLSFLQVSLLWRDFSKACA